MKFSAITLALATASSFVLAQSRRGGNGEEFGGGPRPTSHPGMGGSPGNDRPGDRGHGGENWPPGWTTSVVTVTDEITVTE